MKPARLVHRLRSRQRDLLTWLSRPGVIGPVTGGMLLLAFPPLEWTPLAWVVLAPLLSLLEREGAPARRRGARAWFCCMRPIATCRRSSPARRAAMLWISTLP